MNISTALARLEIPQENFNPPQHAPLNIITQYLDSFKDTVKKQRKSLAKKYHPDICSDDNSLDKMKSINEAADFLEKLGIQQRMPMQQMRPAFSQVIIINGQHFTHVNSSNNSTNSFSFSFSFGG